jgi:hypothetical protein
MRPTALLSFLFVTALPASAAATGMQGHIWSSHCALETLSDARLRPLLEKERTRLDNGSFFPDSGYAAKHEYGETAHWEKFIDGYIKWLRAKYPDPVTEAPQHVAFLMGAASHGLVDQTFDILFMDRQREISGEVEDLDTSMDIFLAVKRKFVPDFAYDANELVDVFGKNVGLTVPAGEIKEGMDLARVGMGFVTEILYKDEAKRAAQYPWAHANYQDVRVPGSYPWGGLAVAKYWQVMLRRLDGNTSADDIVVGSDPPHGVSAGKLDSYATLFVGYGLKRPSITASSFYVTDASGVVPTDIRIRGDEYATTLQLQPKSDWKTDTQYTLVLDTTVETIDGTRPSKKFELPFKVTPLATGAAPASPCPAALVAYPRPSDEEGEEPAPAPAASESSGGCATSGGAAGGATLLAALLALAIARRSHTMSR